jgi:single-strand DNA-binding protein
MLNNITLMGRLTNDVEVRRTGSGVAVASFTIACDRDFSGDGEKKTDFIDCVAWRGTGEFIGRNFTKGKMIVVNGRLEMRDWTDKNGNKRRSAEINVSNAYFGEKKSENTATNFTPPVPTSFDTKDFGLLTDSDAELPF